MCSKKIVGKLSIEPKSRMNSLQPILLLLTGLVLGMRHTG